MAQASHAKLPLLGVLRQVIRLTRDKSLFPNGNELLRRHVVQRYREIAEAKDPHFARAKEQDLRDYAALLATNRKRKEIASLYKGESMEQMDRIGASARRVGLRLPFDNNP
eukprot:Opistho-2@37065